MTPARDPRRPAAIVLLLLVLLVPLATAFGGCRGGSHPESATTIWFCPMHPGYVSERPGTCPICNMDLVEREPEPAAGTAAAPGAPAAGSGGPSERAPVELSAEAIRLAGVRTEPAREGRVERSIRTVGRVVVDERRLHRATTKIGGWVERLLVDFEGRFVRAGQPMLAIYSPELVASQEEYLLAKANAARFLASSIPEVRRGGDDLIEAARQRLRLFDVPESFLDEIDRTRRSSRTVELAAPASGHVVAKSVVQGMRVEPGAELYTVADLSRVWVEADFYESEASLVGVGTPARLTLPYDRAVSVAARAAFVEPRLDPESRTVRLRFDVPNPGLRFKPGMFVDVETEVASEPGLLVPDSAVLETGARQVVFVETAAGRFEPREVELLARAGGFARLAAGPVAPGELVVVKAGFLLDSESRLRAALSAMTAGPSAAGAESPAPDPHAGHGGPP